MANSQLPYPGADRNLGPAVNAVDGTLFTLSTVIVALRLFTRLRITRNFGWDDATITLAQVRQQLD